MASGNHKLKDISRIVNSVRQIRNALNCYSKELKRTLGITGPQLGALHVIDRFPQVSLGELSERMCLHTSTISGIVDRLEIAGYLTRQRSAEDRRVVFLGLTDKGKRTIVLAPPSGFGEMVQGLEKLPAGELQEISRALQSLLRLMKIDANDGSEIGIHDAEVGD